LTIVLWTWLVHNTAHMDSRWRQSPSPSPPTGVTHWPVKCRRTAADNMHTLTNGSVVNVQWLGCHELTHQRRLADARGTQHGYAERLSDAWTAGATGLSGRGQRRAGTGPSRTRIGATSTSASTATASAAAADADHSVVGGRQVFRAGKNRKDYNIVILPSLGDNIFYVVHDNDNWARDYNKL